MDDTDAAAAQPGRNRIGDGQREIHRRRRIDCIAALRQRGRSHLHGEGFIADDLRSGLGRPVETERASEIDRTACEQKSAGRASK